MSKKIIKATCFLGHNIKGGKAHSYSGMIGFYHQFRVIIVKATEIIN